MINKIYNPDITLFKWELKLITKLIVGLIVFNLLNTTIQSLAIDFVWKGHLQSWLYLIQFDLKKK